MTVKFKVKGMNGIIKNLKMSQVTIEKDLGRGLQSAGEFVKKESLALTPIEDGDLQRSIYGGLNKPVKRFMNTIYAEVGYDKTIAPYAAQVHEEVGKLKGKKRRSGKGKYWDVSGEPKFLEKAFFRNVVKIKKIIQSKIKL